MERAKSDKQSRRLLQAVAEQLKLPLLQIARQAELGQISNDNQSLLQTIQRSADAALFMVDSYLFGLELAERQGELALEPVSVASVLNDTAHELSSLSKQYDVQIELAIGGRYGPVMAHPRGLKMALTSLGYTVLTMLPATTKRQKRILSLAAWRGRPGIITGVYGTDDFKSLNSESLKRARALQGSAHQPLTELSGSSAGIFVADTLLQAMASQLRVSRYHLKQGLAATLPPSHQLQLI